MQPVLDCTQSIRISNNNTLKKAIYSHFVQRTKQIKQKWFLDFMLEKIQRHKKSTKKKIKDETKKGYFIRFSDSKFSPRQGMEVTKLYTVSQLTQSH